MLKKIKKNLLLFILFFTIVHWAIRLIVFIVDDENLRQAVGFYSYFFSYPFSNYIDLYDHLIEKFYADSYGTVSTFVSGIIQISLISIIYTLVTERIKLILCKMK